VFFAGLDGHPQKHLAKVQPSAVCSANLVLYRSLRPSPFRKQFGCPTNEGVSESVTDAGDRVIEISPDAARVQKAMDVLFATTLERSGERSGQHRLKVLAYRQGPKAR
jgi:hypothetical protein